MSIFSLGSAGAITGTALAGAGEIVGAATGKSGGAEGAKQSGGKSQIALMLAQKLLEGLTQAQTPQGAQDIMKELAALGKSNPEAVGQALKANPAAADTLSGGLA